MTQFLQMKWSFSSSKLLLFPYKWLLTNNFRPDIEQASIETGESFATICVDHKSSESVTKGLSYVKQ